MSYRLLVPLDGSPRAEEAIPWADELARALYAPVELLRVLPLPPLAGSFSDPLGETVRDAARAEARLQLSLTRARFRVARQVHVEVTFGPVAETIAERGRKHPGTLIVMATHARAGFPRALAGSVAGAVIRQSGVPVLLIRPELLSPPNVPRRALVPLDGSEVSAAVLQQVVPLAKELGWTLVLFTVAQFPPVVLPVQGGTIPLAAVPVLAPGAVMEHLETVAGGLRAQGISVEVAVESGDRAEAITSFADRSGCGLIAMSTHGRRGVGRWALGSVMDAVVRQAEVPVLALRPVPSPPAGLAPLRLSEVAAVAADERAQVDVKLSAQQARVIRLALEYLAWSTTREDRELQDIRAALQAVDAALEGASPTAVV